MWNSTAVASGTWSATLSLVLRFTKVLPSEACPVLLAEERWALLDVAAAEADDGETFAAPPCAALVLALALVVATPLVGFTTYDEGILIVSCR